MRDGVETVRPVYTHTRAEKWTRRRFLSSESVRDHDFRRDFTPCTPLNLAAMRPPIRIDAHVHAWLPPSADRPHVAPMLGASPTLPTADGGALTTALASANVAGALVVQPACYAFDASYVASLAAAAPTKLLVCLSADPGADASTTFQSLSHPSVAALRLNPYLPGWGAAGLASDAAADAYAAAGEAGVPACVMAFKGLAALEPALLALHAHSPSTTLILDHCGFVGVGSLPSGDDAAALIRLAAAVPSLAVKASAWFRVAGNGQPSDCGPLLRFLVDTVGADRVAWGTDWPWVTETGASYGDAWRWLDEWVENGVVSESEAAAIAGGTAARLFGFDLEGGGPPPVAQLNHTIVKTRDVDATASLLAAVTGASVRPRWRRFTPVVLANGVLLDLLQSSNPGPPLHFAFLTNDAGFDAALAALKSRGVPFWAQHTGAGKGEINTLWGGRGVYFSDPSSGHLLEVMTVEYGDPAELDAAVGQKDGVPLGNDEGHV